MLGLEWQSLGPLCPRAGHLHPKGKLYIGLHWDNGKEHGNYYSILGYIGVMEKKMETTIVYWVAIQHE